MGRKIGEKGRDEDEEGRTNGEGERGDENRGKERDEKKMRRMNGKEKT